MVWRLVSTPQARALLGAAVAATLAIAALGATLVYRTNASQGIRHLAADNCTDIEQLKGAIRGVFEDSRRQVAQRFDMTEQQKRLAYARIDVQLARFKAERCPTP